MIALLIPFMILAGIGFAISLAVHLVTLSGHLPPGGERIFVMHGGIFVVWLPAVLVAFRLNQGQQGLASWKHLLAGCPPWMRYAAMGLFGYAFLNFFVAFRGQPAETAGGALSPDVVRGFSGHWMLFYGVAFCILFSAVRKPWLLGRARCPAGHEVAHADRFCTTCGKALPASRVDD